MENTSFGAEKKLEEIFSLSSRGNEQDWAIELSDPDRTEEFLAKYEEIKENDALAYALMSLVIASFDDLVGSRYRDNEKEPYELIINANNNLNLMYNENELGIWKNISFILNSRKKLFFPLIEYWKYKEEGCEDVGFYVSLLFRKEFKF
ncbi:hypothetical protein IWQ54_001176 [Labrenzia sp. EL_195]|nr:hypothetical protein [Labrenzia sp. EL_195]